MPAQPVLARRPRRGLSKLELLTCLVAVGGGVWIGANYLGVDLEGAAFVALDETQLLDQVPEEWRPSDPDGPDADGLNAEQRRALERARVAQQLQQLHAEVDSLTNGSAPVAATDEIELSPRDAVTRDRTVAYWQSLTQVVLDVTSIEERVAPLVTAEQQGRAIALRRRALAYGQRATELLDADGVDPRALETGVRVAEWLGQGAETLESALELRDRQSAGGRTVTAAQFWSQINGDLRMRTDLLRRKSVEASGYLSGRYFTQFPPLAI
ncbi:MAG: hypothetical protein AAF805_05485 [Planctomycetota bacterium]